MSIFQSPVDGSELITSYYKNRPGIGDGFHDGVDYRADLETSIFAVGGGTIVRASGAAQSPSYGNVIIIDHGVINGRRTYSLYAHLSDYSTALGADGEPLLDENGQSRDWREGDTVFAGQELGLAGDSGSAADDVHLHFEILLSPDENEINFSTSGGVGFNTRIYAVNPLRFLYGDGENITHEINTYNDTYTENNQTLFRDYATVWGDEFDDYIISPEPGTNGGNPFTSVRVSGKSGDDLLVGNSGNDHLMGGSDNDVLVGGAGNDMIWGWQQDADTEVVPARLRELEDDGGNDELIGGISRTEDDNAVDQLFGGDGFDTYHVGNGDIINDADDRGRVFYNGAVLVPGLHGSEQEENQYVSLDGRFTYTVSGPDLIVSVNGSNPPASFTIQNFNSGNLGIILRDMPDTSYSSPYQISEAQADGEHIVADDNDPNTADFNPTGNDAIIGLGGSSVMIIEPVTQGTVVYGDGPDVPEEQQGTDGIFVDFARWSANVGLEQPNIPVPVEGAVVFAQGGDDWVAGSYDHDWIEGGAGHDALEGSYGDDVLIGGTGNDYIDAGAGSDIVIAAELNDATGNDNNLLSGGAGDVIKPSMKVDKYWSIEESRIQEPEFKRAA